MATCKTCNTTYSNLSGNIGSRQCPECIEEEFLSNTLNSDDGRAFLCRIIDPGPLSFGEKIQNIGLSCFGFFRPQLSWAAAVFHNDKFMLVVSNKARLIQRKLLEYPLNEVKNYSITQEPSREAWGHALKRGALSGAIIGGLGLLAFAVIAYSGSEVRPSISPFFALTFMLLMGIILGASLVTIIQLFILITQGTSKLHKMCLFLAYGSCIILYVSPSRKQKAVDACKHAGFILKNKIESNP